MSPKGVAFLILAAGLLAGCSMFDSDNPNVLGRNDPDKLARTNDPYHTDPDYSANGDVFGDRYASVSPGSNAGLFNSIFGSKKDGNDGGGGAGIGVNSYLWHASLDTVNFMPLASADPFGGVIITDWYSAPDRPNERFKLNILILGRDLRADGVRVSVFRQVKNGEGSWSDASVDQATATDIENAILTRAREMRLSTASSQ